MISRRFSYSLGYKLSHSDYLTYAEGTLIGTLAAAQGVIDSLNPSLKPPV